MLILIRIELLTLVGISVLTLTGFSRAKNTGASPQNLNKDSKVSTDLKGNIFIAGCFYWNNLKLGSTTLANAGYDDIFLAKYDSLGNILWAKKAGGAEGDVVKGIDTDTSGSIFITGYFESASILFGSTTLTNADATGSTNDIFLAKYNASGNLLWATSAGSTFSEEAQSVSCDANGNTFITGNFRSPITFGSTTLITNGYNDIFLVKYNGIGNVLWAKGEGGTEQDYGTSVSIDANGDALITGGYISYTIPLGPRILTLFGLVHVPDIFLAKIDNLTAIGEGINVENNLTLFPNPSDGIITIQGTSQNDNLIITNQLGQTILATKTELGKTEINISNESPGIYFVQINSENSRVIKKLILQ